MVVLLLYEDGRFRNGCSFQRIIFGCYIKYSVSCIINVIHHRNMIRFLMVTMIRVKVLDVSDMSFLCFLVLVDVI
jgi:hypothetical protein